MCAYKLKEVKRLGSVSYWKYEASDSYYYAVYRSPYGVSCYLNGEIEVSCNEL